MEIKQLKSLYDAMSQYGYSELEIELGSSVKYKLKLDSAAESVCEPETGEESDALPAEENKNEFIEIRSEKVGTFIASNQALKQGDLLHKGDVLGYIEGISGPKGREAVKCPADGILISIEVSDGSVADYGKLLFRLKSE